MKITHQLRLDRLAVDGMAQIQLTSWWEGYRLRLGTGAVVKPEHWDEGPHLASVVVQTKCWGFFIPPAAVPPARNPPAPPRR